MGSASSTHRSRHLVRRLAIVATTGATTAAFAALGFAPAAHAAQLGGPSTFGGASPSFGGGASQNAAFVQTNDATGNAVIAYARGGDGQLRQVGRYPTGGLGGAEAGAVVDPLASQGSLTYDQRDQLLFAVNAGSDTFTAFGVNGTHLQRHQVLDSGGGLPTSVGFAKDVVYVLDAGGAGAISGFTIDNRGWLDPIANSTRSLGLANPADPNFLASPSQVSVTPDRKEVVVGTKTNGVVDVFTLDHGVPSTAAVSNASAGGVPFALAFDNLGRLLVAEASGGVSSYWVQRDGELTTISSHVVNGQTATCWSTIAKGYVYVANAGSNTISSYTENWRGQLTLLNATAAATDAGTVDLASTSDGRYLYEETTAAGAVDEFAVNDDGSLTKIGALTGFTPDNGTGFEGIAAT